MRKKYKRGLFVGRFQPVHLGHSMAIKKILDEEVEEVVIVIGSAQYSHETRNPFTAGERVYMVKLALQEVGANLSKCYLIPVPDVDMHSCWVSVVLSYVPKFDVVYTNDPLTRRLFIEAGYKVMSVPYIRREVYNATEVRRRMISNQNWQELLPRSVARYITEIGGVERLKSLLEKDKLA